MAVGGEIGVERQAEQSFLVSSIPDPVAYVEEEFGVVIGYEGEDSSALFDDESDVRGVVGEGERYGFVERQAWEGWRDSEALERLGWFGIAAFWDGRDCGRRLVLRQRGYGGRR